MKTPPPKQRKMKKELFTFACEKCGLEGEKDDKMSNNNWTVIKNEPCKKCGGKITIKFL